MRSAIALLFVAVTTAACSGCESKSKAAPPVPASSDPTGADLVVGAIVAADEKSGGVRLYKVKETNWFPDPVGDELVMIAFREKGQDFKHAADLWHQRKLIVELPNVRVQRHMFRKRDYRVIAFEPVTDADKALKIEDPIPPRASATVAP